VIYANNNCMDVGVGRATSTTPPKLRHLG